MPHIDSHPPGSFCWVELATTDQNAAKSFYSQLFNWTVYDAPMGPDEVYTMFQLEGEAAAAAYTMRPEQLSSGVPPNWMIYVAVESADATAKKAADLEGKTLAPPFDVFDVGRMAILQDPGGAVFSIWQGLKHKGTGITGEAGTLGWADLNTLERDRAITFYSNLFGWKFEAGEKDPSGYLHIVNAGQSIGGTPPLKQLPPNTPPHWLPYFAVSDCDAVANKAKAAGANLIMPPMDMEGVVRMSIIADPQGAVFAIYKEMPRA